MKNISRTVFLLAVLFGFSGCDNRGSLYSELVVQYRGDSDEYLRFVPNEEINFGTQCVRKFKEMGVFSRCLNFYGKSCFLETNTKPDNHKLCPPGCGGRCLIAVRESH